MLPIAFINSLLRYSLSELTLRFRTRLTKYLYNLYMRGYVITRFLFLSSYISNPLPRFVFYRLGNLDNRIPNADQLLTTDVEKFCASITEVHSFIPPLHTFFFYLHRLNTISPATASHIVYHLNTELCNFSCSPTSASHFSTSSSSLESWQELSEQRAHS